MSHSFTYAELSGLPTDVLVMLLQTVGSSQTPVTEAQRVDVWAQRVVSWINGRRGPIRDIDEYVDVPNICRNPDMQMQSHPATAYLLFAPDPRVMPYTVYRELSRDEENMSFDYYLCRVQERECILRSRDRVEGYPSVHPSIHHRGYR
jgi:hypothetical protein